MSIRLIGLLLLVQLVLSPQNSQAEWRHSVPPTEQSTTAEKPLAPPSDNPCTRKGFIVFAWLIFCGIAIGFSIFYVGFYNDYFLHRVIGMLIDIFVLAAGAPTVAHAFRCWQGYKRTVTLILLWLAFIGGIARIAIGNIIFGGLMLLAAIIALFWRNGMNKS